MQDSAEGNTSDNEETIENEIDQKYLTFWTDSELFGIPISDVVQIISIQEITPLPDFPEYAKGVINLRGNIIPVIDIRLRFGKPEIPYNESTCIIVTRIEDTYMGFIVDSVDEVTDIEDDNITDAPKVSKDITNKYLTGIGQIGERVVLLLDVGKILTEKEYRKVCETTEQTAEPAAAEQTTDEKPVKEQTAAKQTTDVKPVKGQAAAEQTTDVKPAKGQAAAEQTTDEKPVKGNVPKDLEKKDFGKESKTGSNITPISVKKGKGPSEKG